MVNYEGRQKDRGIVPGISTNIPGYRIVGPPAGREDHILKAALIPWLAV